MHSKSTALFILYEHTLFNIWTAIGLMFFFAKHCCVHHHVSLFGKLTRNVALCENRTTFTVYILLLNLPSFPHRFVLHLGDFHNTSYYSWYIDYLVASLSHR